MVDTLEGWHERVRITFFMFSANRSYSSSTSCSRGVRSSAVTGRLVVDSESIVCLWSRAADFRQVARKGIPKMARVQRRMTDVLVAAVVVYFVDVLLI